MASSSSTSQRFASSLIPQSEHDIFLLRLLSLPVSYDMISYIAALTQSVVDDAVRSTPNAPPSPNGSNYVPPLEDFIISVCRLSNVQTTTLLPTVIYLDRLRNKMPARATGKPGTAHRLFMASLIVAAKYLNDSSPKNKHWVSCTAELFDLREVDLMEKQLLFLLDFDLAFSESEALSYFQPFLALAGPSLYDSDAYHAARNTSIRVDPPPYKSKIAKFPSDVAAYLRREPVLSAKETRENALKRVTQGSRLRLERKRSTPEVTAPPPAVVALPKAPKVQTQQSISKPSALLHPGIQASIRQSTTLPSVETLSSLSSLSGSISASIRTIRSTSSSLSDILSRGPSTDSVSSSSSSSSASAGALTEDYGTSSSSATSSEDESLYSEEEKEVDVVHVHPSLRGDSDVDDHELEAMTADFAKYGIVSKKKSYGSVERRDERSYRRSSQATQVPQRSSRVSFGPRRRSQSIASSASSQDEADLTDARDVEFYHPLQEGPRSSGARYTRSNDSLNAVRPPQSAYASSSSTITTMTSDSKPRLHRSSQHQTRSSRHYVRPSRTPASTPIAPAITYAQTKMYGPRQITVAHHNSKHSSSGEERSRASSHLARSFSTMGIPITTATESALAYRGKKSVTTSKPSGFGASLKSFLIGSSSSGGAVPTSGGSKGRGVSAAFRR